MLHLRMTLDGKIASVNKIYLRGKNGGVYLAPEVKQYREEVAPVVKEYHKKAEGKYDGGLLVFKADIWYDFFTKGNEVRRMDVDNFAKQLIDSIFPNIGLDDKLIFDLRLRKIQYKGNPKCVVEIKEIPHDKQKNRK